MASPRALPAITAAAVLLAGCQQVAVKPARPYDESKQVVLTIADNSPEQVFLGEIYSQALKRRGRDAVVEVAESSPIRAVETASADVTITCAGRALEELDPPRAEELGNELAKAGGTANINDGEAREETYAAVMASLPHNMDATDPSNAVACGEADSDTDALNNLPNNLVPLYRTPVLGRSERLALNVATGLLTTQKLNQAVEEVEAGGNVEEIAGALLEAGGI